MPPTPPSSSWPRCHERSQPDAQPCSASLWTVSGWSCPQVEGCSCRGQTADDDKEVKMRMQQERLKRTECIKCSTKYYK